jgi:hypothetical protein
MNQRADIIQWLKENGHKDNNDSQNISLKTKD